MGDIVRFRSEKVHREVQMTVAGKLDLLKEGSFGGTNFHLCAQ